MIKKFGCLILIVLLILSMGCTKKEDPLETFKNDMSYYYGKAENGTFHNDYLNFDLSYPEDWNVVEDQIKEQMELMAAQLVEEDETSLDDLDLEQIKMYNMLFLYKYPIENRTQLNPSLLAVVERLEEGSEVSEEEYLQASRLAMESNDLPMGFEYKIVDGYEKVQLSGKTFTVMEINIMTGVLEIGQKYYSYRVGDKMLNFMISYSDETKEKELQGVLDTLTFN